MRLLLVETDASYATSGLGDERTFLTWAEDADEALSLLRHDSYDLIVLNMTRQTQDGFDLIRRLRVSRNATPLLALTGSKSGDLVHALGLGADDAMADPGDPSELRARIDAILRRSCGFSQPLLRVGELSLCQKTGEVRFAGALVPLTGREFAILELLVLRRGTVLTKPTLFVHLYNGTDGPELKVIDVFVCKLRKKLERAGAPELVSTVWGRGYAFYGAAARRPGPSLAEAVLPAS